MPEQQKIGTFFKQLDYLITLHQRKLAKLKELKQGYLQKLFPENGSKFPQLRFAGFADAWEQRKLGELGTLRRGKSKHRPRNDPKLFGGDYPFIQTGDVASSGLYLQNFTQTLNNFGLTQSKLWNKGTLVITIAANVADSAILAIDAAFPDSVIGFTSETSSVEFDKFLLDGLSDELKRTAPTGSQANLNLEILSNTSEYVPSISEQGKIARFLIQFEDTIALHERKLDLLKELKKGYLQQLFPKNSDKTPQLRFVGFTGNWKQRKLGEVGQINPKTALPNEFIYISLESVVNNRLLSTQKFVCENAPSRAQRVAKFGDVFFKMSAPIKKTIIYF